MENINGQLAISILINLIYLFREIDFDQDVEVRISFNTVSGRVTASNSDTIDISLEKHVGETVHESYLIISSNFLLQKLLQHLV